MSMNSDNGGRDADGGLTRREFLARTGAAAVAGAALAGGAQADEPKTPGDGKMPTRTLGKTGAKVSLLGVGGGSQWSAAPEDEALTMLERALAAGVTYFDTAASYGPDRISEKRFGKLLPKYRKQIFLATKTDDRTYDGLMRSVEESLKCLQTDRLDLMQMHDIGPKDDLNLWEKPDGGLTALRKLKDQKVVRFIGFTGHQQAEVHKKVLETLEFDTVLMAINAADKKAFRELALPVAVQKKMGVIAMKTTRGLVGSGPGKATPQELLHWAWDLPIAVAIVGMNNKAMLESNLSLAMNYKPGKVDAVALTARLAPHVTDAQVGWALPGYRDVC